MSNIIKKELANLTYDAMAEYSSSVILDRAIPDIRDGLKPVQRRVLWQSHLSKLIPTSNYMKLNKLSGMTLAFHPHGSTSVSQTAVGLSQEWTKIVPLIDIQGNNGSIDGASAAADRYIEARQAIGAELLLENIDHNAVDLTDNFDNTEKEPRVLPAAFPVAMTNGTQGIAVGISTRILPHNPLELLDGCKEIVKKNINEPKDLYSIIKGPDFPTGAYIIGKDAVKEEIDTGKARFKIRGKVKYNLKGQEPNLEITEIPYGITTDKLIEKMANVLENAKALGVIDIRDETQDNDDVSIQLIFKKGAKKEQLEKVEHFLYKKTDLEINLSANNIMITKGRQKTLSVFEYLNLFVEFRRETLQRIWQYDLNKLIARREILEGLIKTYDIIDQIVVLAKNSEGRKDLSEKLQAEFDFTQRQSETIASMPIYQLGKQDFNKLKSELENNINKSSNLENWLNSPDACDEKLIEDFEKSMEKLKDYKRRTKIVSEAKAKEVKDIKVEDVIEAKSMRVVIKKDLQMFQIGQRAFDNQIENYKNDDIIAFVDGLTTEYVTAVTKQGKTVTRLINDLEHSSLEAGSNNLNKVVNDLKSTDEFIGIIINKQNEVSPERILLISDFGYVKVLSGEKLMPSTRTKAYVNKTGLASTLKKQGDSLVVMEVIDKKRFNDLELKVVLNDSSKKSGIANRYVELSKWDDRNDGPGGSGFNGINTKNGQLTFKEYEIYKKDKPDTDAKNAEK